MREPNVIRGVCPYCGIDAQTGTYAHADRKDCIIALRNVHSLYRCRISNLVRDHLEEVHNEIGGVIGYKLNLSAEETDQLCREIEK